MICLSCCIRRSFTRELDKAHYDKNGQDTSKILEDHRDIEGRNNHWEMRKMKRPALDDFTELILVLQL